MSERDDFADFYDIGADSLPPRVRDFRDRPDLPSFLTWRELHAVHRYVERLVPELGLQEGDDVELSIHVRDRGREHSAAIAPWVELSVGGQQFAMWRVTRWLYPVDADGAVADDPIMTPDDI
jgi:hypothetical protein